MRNKITVYVSAFLCLLIMFSVNAQTGFAKSNEEIEPQAQYENKINELDVT